MKVARWTCLQVIAYPSGPRFHSLLSQALDYRICTMFNLRFSTMVARLVGSPITTSWPILEVNRIDCPGRATYRRGVVGSWDGWSQWKSSTLDRTNCEL